MGTLWKVMMMVEVDELVRFFFFCLLVVVIENYYRLKIICYLRFL